MIVEALKYIRAMKHQLEAYTYAEKALEELSALAETGAAIRAETRDAESRLAKLNGQAETRLNEAKLQLDKLNAESEAKLAAANKAAKEESDHRAQEVVNLAEAYQHYEESIKAHKEYMAKATKEKAEMEIALAELKKRFKV